MLPALFVSHGAPTFPLTDAPARTFLETLSTHLSERPRAPNAVCNRPTEDHLLPLFMALGAGVGGPSEQLHQSTTHGVLRMDAFAFGGAV